MAIDVCAAEPAHSDAMENDEEWTNGFTLVNAN